MIIFENQDYYILSVERSIVLGNGHKFIRKLLICYAVILTGKWVYKVQSKIHSRFLQI